MDEEDQVAIEVQQTRKPRHTYNLRSRVVDTRTGRKRKASPAGGDCGPRMDEEEEVVATVRQTKKPSHTYHLRQRRVVDGGSKRKRQAFPGSVAHEPVTKRSKKSKAPSIRKIEDMLNKVDTSMK